MLVLIGFMSRDWTCGSRLVSFPFTMMASESKGSVGNGGIPPLPLTVKPLTFPVRRSILQAWATVCSDSTRFLGKSRSVWRVLTSGVLIEILPSKPKSELASISLVKGFCALSSILKSAWAFILIFPPRPSLALAMISLPPFWLGKAIINSASILILPPLAASKAWAEMRLLLRRVKLSSICNWILPPWPNTVSASIVPRFSSMDLASTSILPPLPLALLLTFTSAWLVTERESVLMIILPPLPSASPRLLVKIALPSPSLPIPPRYN